MAGKEFWTFLTPKNEREKTIADEEIDDDSDEVDQILNEDDDVP